MASRQQTIVLSVASAVVLATGGCSGSDGGPSEPLPAVAPTSAAPLPLTPPVEEGEIGISESPSPEPSNATLKLGQKHRLKTDTAVVEVAVLDHRHGDGYEGALVRTCNRGNTKIGVSRDPWSLGYDDFESLHTTDTTGGPNPEYPYMEERRLGKGECAKGWINYTDIPGQRPDGIQYAPLDLDPIKWLF